jgi:hypothetical protein
LALSGNIFAINKKYKMKKTITLLTLLLSVLSYAQEKSNCLDTEEIVISKLTKYGTVYYDKERESDMLKIQTGVMKLSGYNPKDIPEFVSIYNSLYTKELIL